MKGFSGLVGPDGRSALPEGVIDPECEDLAMDPEVEEKLSELFRNAVGGDDELKARYKLDVIFQRERSAHRAYPGMIVAWTNGSFSHGGGDEAVYFCTSRVEAKDGGERTCLAPIDLKLISGRVAVCPSCRTAVRPQELQGQRFARLHTQQWAELITKYFQLLECSADIRIGVFASDLRRVSNEELERDRGGERLYRARNNRTYVIYPLSAIVRDTTAGADMQDRIKAFLSA